MKTHVKNDMITMRIDTFAKLDAIEMAASDGYNSLSEWIVHMLKKEHIRRKCTQKRRAQKNNN